MKRKKTKAHLSLKSASMFVRELFFLFQTSLDLSRNIIAEQKLLISSETGLISAKTKDAAVEHGMSANVANKP